MIIVTKREWYLNQNNCNVILFTIVIHIYKALCSFGCYIL